MADLVVTADDVVVAAGAQTDLGTAGEAITAGLTLYKGAAGTLLKALADTSPHAAAVGIALNNAAEGQPVSYVKAGGIDPGATVVVGTIYGVTDTAGGIGDVAERASADFVTILGIGTTASNIDLAINHGGVDIP